MQQSNDEQIYRYSNVPLEYGVIYVFSNLYTPQDMLDDYRQVLVNECANSRFFERVAIELTYCDLPPTIVALRFNSGNIGKKHIVSCRVCGDITIDRTLISCFVKNLFDFSDTSDGDVVIDENQVLSPAERAIMRDAIESPDLNAKNSKVRAAAEQAVVTIPENRLDYQDVDVELEKQEQLQREFLQVTGKMVANYVVTTHNDPQILLEGAFELSDKFVLHPKVISPIVIDSDLNVVLPGYGHTKVKMSPLSKTLYILFLNHPEGIELRNIPDYRDQLQEIYDIIMPGRDPQASDDHIDNLVDPLNGTLNQQLSRIKRLFKAIIIDDSTARNYYISGRRGTPYAITLSPTLISLPAILKLEP